MFMALLRWRGGQGRGSSRTRRSSASIRRAFASASSRRRRGCAPRTSCLPATSISARRCGGCRKRCCRSGATPRVTAPLGERLAEAITFQGSVTDSDGIDHFRDRRWRPPDVGQPGDHLGGAAARVLPGAIQRRIPTIFPQLGKVEIAEVCGGAVGQTVHGMPQIGQLRKGPVGRQRLRPPGPEHLGDGRPAHCAQHPVGRRTLAAVFAVRTGLGGRADRPGRRPCHRDVGAGKLRRRRRAGPLPGTGAGPGA